MITLKNDEICIVPKKRELPVWVKWSMSEHTEDELRDAILNKPELVCYTYICRYSQMSSDFIENELIVLSTGIFTGYPEFYTENNKKLVSKILYLEPTGDRYEYQQALDPDDCDDADPIFVNLIKQYKTSLRSRVDWWQIACYQDNLTSEFRKKYAKKFKEAKARVDRPDGNMKALDCN